MRARVAYAVIVCAIATGCNSIDTDPATVSAVAIDPAASPSIVAGDSLRDTLGVARPISGSAFNAGGTALTSVPMRFRAGDPGIAVDSVRGFVVADTARSTPVRIFGVVGGLQTIADTLYIVPRPDTAYAVSAIDSVVYVIADTTKNYSGTLTLQLFNKAGATPLPVRSYLVSYAITYPADTSLAQLYQRDLVRRSSIDTTASDGTSGRRVRVQPLKLANPNDSVVVLASVRYRGTLVKGSPVRFVVTVKPHS